MIKNFFKIAYRNLLRSKGFSVINITGLAIGMAAAILILLWIQNEVSVDRFHKNTDRIYRVWNRVVEDGAIQCTNNISEPAARAIEQDLPEVERAVRVKRAGDMLFRLAIKRSSRQAVL
ncbi:ABC transporter permease [Mucilaginibacter humi]|uniref:ABC transporter permease n=1 Tax=Mucilaginibacter humi TaxID=2732510 RepID=UPI001FEA2990|nr:ABC transporter permease [Mucilaginibacter humi]